MPPKKKAKGKQRAVPAQYQAVAEDEAVEDAEDPEAELPPEDAEAEPPPKKETAKEVVANLLAHGGRMTTPKPNTAMDKWAVRTVVFLRAAPRLRRSSTVRRRARRWARLRWVHGQPPSTICDRPAHQSEASERTSSQ